MPVPLYDAHVHLADASLLPHQDDIWARYTEIGLGKAVVVGTSPEDWSAVLKLAGDNAAVIPAVGLHPWKVNSAPDNWKQQLLESLDQGARVIGEIGLDKWIEDHDIERQQDAFCFQLTLAKERNLPCSIHCLRATGPLMETLRSVALPERGIHIHAYNGPVELVPELVKLGAYFSFNAGQLKPNAAQVPERIRAIPTERLLIETDAPDFLPVEQFREFTLKDPTLCHPANLRCGYEAIAKIRGSSTETLAEQLEDNFKRYFE